LDSDDVGGGSVEEDVGPHLRTHMCEWR
ncbi:hypothetical protein A2U01_0104135, partial [Trifolium medium]|nr:hypothetical protein [Trifolium medium]